MAALIVLCACLGFLSGCAHGGCNNVPQRPLPEPPPGNATHLGAATNNSEWLNTSAPPQPAVQTPPAAAAKFFTVQVFKPTGEKQCGEGAAVPLDVMKEQLTSQKIQVSEAHTQPDGLMHMALCGAPSGNIHVFTIPRKSLRRARRLGFKVFGSHVR